MRHNQLTVSLKSTTYFFLKFKDVHIENGLAFITLLARLTRETTLIREGKKQTQVETAWVEIEELQMEHAPEKVRNLPNCMQRYAITENVFRSLYHLSKESPEDLFYIIPYHHESIRKNFLSRQQLNQVSPFPLLDSKSKEMGSYDTL